MNLWDNIKDAYSGLEPADIWSVGDWMSGTPSQWEIPNYTQVNPLWGSVSGWGSSPEEKQQLASQMNEGMDNRAMSLGMTPGMTKIIGAPGGARTIKSFHDKTGDYLGSLGYKDVPGRGAIFQSIESKSPRGTAELLGRFRDEMGPLMDAVKVPGPLKPQSIPAFESWVNRGRLDQWPNLKQNFQGAIDQARSSYPELIPQNTYSWNKANIWDK